MKQWIVLLRGVMPTGKNRVPMAQLRLALEQAGYLKARTFLQSGNVLLQSGETAPALSRHVAEIIRQQIGPQLAVIVKIPAQIVRVLAENPYGAGYDQARVFYMLFNGAPKAEAAAKLRAADFGENKVILTKAAAYLYIPGNAARSKLNNNAVEKILALDATTRGGNTLKKLAALSQEKNG